MKTKQLTKDLYWVGNLDPELRVFDIIMFTEFGTTYNSYLLKGSEKTALFETSKARCFDEYLDKVKELTSIEDIDYIIVDHTEPDHVGAVEKLLDLNPRIKLVGSGTAMSFMKEICNRDFTAVTVKDGDTLSLGNKTLRFFAVPNLHWPDTIYTYIEEEKTLVTCDSFGSHYSCEGITNDKIENQDNYMKALRYYFDMILGPFKPFMLKAIDKIKDLDIAIICPGHGPVLTEEPRKIVEICKEWSTVVNPNKKKTVVIPYVAAYGYTGILAEKIAEGIREAGDIDVRVYDMVAADVSSVMEEIGFADGFLLGTPTILGDALKPIWDMTTSMFPGVHGGKFASAFGSYGWSGEGVPNMIQRLKQLRMKVYGDGFRVRFKPSMAQLTDAFDFGYGFGLSVLSGEFVEPKKREATSWKCLICGEIVEGTAPPASCPVCGVGPDKFVEVSVAPVGFHSEKEENIVVIGNGAAGTAACEEIRRRNPVCGIEMIARENIIGYNRPMLTKGILSELDMLNLLIKPYSWYSEHNIKLTLDREVMEIRPETKTLILSDGSERDYDKLILATGAESFVPPIKGADKKGVFAIRALADVNDLREYMDSVKAKKAAVIGGGVLGLEAAWELKKAGLDVFVIEGAPVIMGRQLDEKGSVLLKAAMAKAGVKTSEGRAIEEITGSGSAEGVKLADGTLLDADLVIVSTGIKQNVELAKAIGLEVTRSIAVNDRMETGIEGIYACGDCAEFGGVNYAIWPQAVDMGKVAGANAAGDNLVYRQIVPAITYNGMGTRIFSIGDVGKDADKKYKTKEYCDEENLVYEKLYYANGRFCGGILIGDDRRVGELLEAYEEKRTISKM